MDALSGVRHDVDAFARACGIDGGAVEDLILAVSELVTNALVHGAAPVELVIAISDRWLRVEVHDAATQAPMLRRPSAHEPGGRGMVIVAALSGGRWGVRLTPKGKLVWARLSR